MAHRGLRVVERPRRGRDRTVPGHGDQHAQPGYVEHAPTIDPADRSAHSARPGLLGLIGPGQGSVRHSPPGRLKALPSFVARLSLLSPGSAAPLWLVSGLRAAARPAGGAARPQAPG